MSANHPNHPVDTKDKDAIKNNPADLNEDKEQPVDIAEQGSSSPMGGENNVTGNSSDRQGDTNNSSGGSYRKSNKEI